MPDDVAFACPEPAPSTGNLGSAEVEGRNLQAPYDVHGCGPPAGPSARLAVETVEEAKP